MLESIVLPEQSRVYIGPLSDDVVGMDLTQQFSQFGTVSGVSRLRASETSCKRGFGFVEFKEGQRAVNRAFGSKVFVKGKLVNVTLSRMAMEVMLCETSAFFFDAFLYCDDGAVDKHFRRFGPVFRATHLLNQVRDDRRSLSREDAVINKSYGFVDFVDGESTMRCLAEKTQLLHPGQYVKVSKHLPQALQLDFMAIGDKQGNEIKRKLERVLVTEGSWGDPKKVRGDGITTSQVRIPRVMVGKLIGERGKNIVEITRDSKTKINIPTVSPDDTNVVVSVTGKREDIRTAQYLMQRLLRGQR